MRKITWRRKKHAEELTLAKEDSTTPDNFKPFEQDQLWLSYRKRFRAVVGDFVSENPAVGNVAIRENDSQLKTTPMVLELTFTTGAVVSVYLRDLVIYKININRFASVAIQPATEKESTLSIVERELEEYFRYHHENSLEAGVIEPVINDFVALVWGTYRDLIFAIIMDELELGGAPNDSDS